MLGSPGCEPIEETHSLCGGGFEDGKGRWREHKIAPLALEPDGPLNAAVVGHRSEQNLLAAAPMLAPCCVSVSHEGRLWSCKGDLGKHFRHRESQACHLDMKIGRKERALSRCGLCSSRTSAACRLHHAAL